MAIVPVLLYPDPRLKEVSDEVKSIDQAILNVITDLLDTLYASPGCVGIAAPQIGALTRIIIVDASRNKKAGTNRGQMILINPEIIKSEGEVMAREGCLSLPDLTANVVRARDIVIRAMDQEGNKVEFETTDFEARVILHERDHLDGLLFLDRVASLKTDVFRRKRYIQPEQRKSAVEADSPQP
jgi:peptide deformylase